MCSKRCFPRKFIDGPRRGVLPCRGISRAGLLPVDTCRLLRHVLVKKAFPLDMSKRKCHLFKHMKEKNLPLKVHVCKNAVTADTCCRISSTDYMDAGPRLDKGARSSKECITTAKLNNIYLSIINIFLRAKLM